MAKQSCLIGSSGFIGSNLELQHSFDDLYRSTNIDDIKGKQYKLLVCAGVSAAKWIANKHPEEDSAAIDRLFHNLVTVSVEQAVLISTVDVYPITINGDELFDCASLPNNHYGAHRLDLESRFAAHFPRLSILRLPGVFGPGLKKNVIFDLMHNNMLECINPASLYQYYDVRGLWADIEVAIDGATKLLNLVTEPILTSEIVNQFFPGLQVGSRANPAAFYDVHTRHAGMFGKTGHYRWSRREVLSQLDNYLQTLARLGAR